jgi:hypothetical protein
MNDLNWPEAALWMTVVVMITVLILGFFGAGRPRR